MAQAAADGGDRHAFVYKMAGMGMPQVMDVYERYAGLLCVFFQAVAYCYQRKGEKPLRRLVQLPNVLLHLLHQGMGHRNLADAVGSLGCGDGACGLHEAFADVYGVCLEIEVINRKRPQFSYSHAAIEQEQEAQAVFFLVYHGYELVEIRKLPE